MEGGGAGRRRKEIFVQVVCERKGRRWDGVGEGGGRGRVGGGDHGAGGRVEGGRRSYFGFCVLYFYRILRKIV